MAQLTIQQEPEYIQPAYNDVIYVVTSVHSGFANYQYRASVTVGGDTILLKCFPDPTYGSGVFNIGRILETYVTSDIDNTTSGFQTNDNSFVQYSVSFGEEYGASSGVVVYPNKELIANSSGLVCNASLDYLNFINFSFSDFLAENYKCFNYFNVDLIRKVQATDDAWIYYGTNDVSTITSASITCYNQMGVIVRQVSVGNPFVNNQNYNEHFIRFSAGVNNVNGISGDVVDIVGTGTIIDVASVVMYDVSFSPNDSEVYRFEIQESDCKFETVRVHWLNALGAFESFNFTKKSVKETNINRSKFKKVFGGLTYANSYGYNAKAIGTKSFYIENKDTLKIKTDWLTDQESILLQSLVESSEIYIDRYNGFQMVSATCLETKFSERKTITDKCFSLELTLELGFSRYSQRQ